LKMVAHDAFYQVTLCTTECELHIDPR
jgi:hypothetical protein